MNRNHDKKFMSAAQLEKFREDEVNHHPNQHNNNKLLHSLFILVITKYSSFRFVSQLPQHVHYSLLATLVSYE